MPSNSLEMNSTMPSRRVPRPEGRGKVKVAIVVTSIFEIESQLLMWCWYYSDMIVTYRMAAWVPAHDARVRKRLPTGRSGVNALGLGGEWRRRPELNRRKRFCRPLRNHSATSPLIGLAIGGGADRQHDARPGPAAAKACLFQGLATQA